MVMQSVTSIVSPLDYPSDKYYLLPCVTTNKIQRGSLKICFNQKDLDSTNSLNEDEVNSELKKLVLINEPDLPQIDKMTKPMKVALILNKIHKNPIEVEFKISYFYASCNGIPKSVLNDMIPPENVNWLDLLDNIPKLTEINRESLLNLPDLIIDILHWLIIGFKKPVLTITDEHWMKEQFPYEKYQEPVLALRVCGNEMKNDLTINSVNRKTAYGFLPVNNYDVFSLVYHWKYVGKDKCMNDRFCHAFNIAELQSLWPNSAFGKCIKTVLVIEYYQHPCITYVGDVPGSTLSLSLDLNSSNPPGYYLITNTSYARVSHILLYDHDTTYWHILKKYLNQAFQAYGSLFYSFLITFLVAHILNKSGLNSIQ